MLRKGAFKKEVQLIKERIHKLTQAHGIRGRHKKCYKATTDSKHAFSVAPNLLNHKFRPDLPDQAWATDITYVPTQEGWLYLAAVMDLHTHMIVGWSMDSRMTRDLVINALRMAWFRRKPKAGLLHHSDRGSQYANHDYQAVLKEYSMTASMSRQGNCWDNAAMESLFNSLKNERVHHARYQTREIARQDIFDYIRDFITGDATIPHCDLSVLQSIMPVRLPSRNWQYRRYAWYPKNRGKFSMHGAV